VRFFFHPLSLHLVGPLFSAFSSFARSVFAPIIRQRRHSRAPLIFLPLPPFLEKSSHSPPFLDLRSSPRSPPQLLYSNESVNLSLRLYSTHAAPLQFLGFALTRLICASWLLRLQVPQSLSQTLHLPPPPPLPVCFVSFLPVPLFSIRLPHCVPVFSE